MDPIQRGQTDDARGIEKETDQSLWTWYVACIPFAVHEKSQCADLFLFQDIFLAVLSSFFITSVVLVVLHKEQVSTVLGIFGIIGGGMVLMITLLVRCLGPSPEQTVVNELRHASERASSRTN